MEDDGRVGEYSEEEGGAVAADEDAQEGVGFQAVFEEVAGGG